MAECGTVVVKACVGRYEFLKGDEDREVCTRWTKEKGRTAQGVVVDSVYEAFYARVILNKTTEENSVGGELTTTSWDQFLEGLAEWKTKVQRGWSGLVCLRGGCRSACGSMWENLGSWDTGTGIACDKPVCWERTGK